MNNLTTRKIVLGLLMALVLAFGVQGVAEAITRPSGQAEAHLNTVHGIVVDVGESDIDISSINIVPDRANSRETVSITKSSGVTLTDNFYGLSSVSLTEVDTDLTNSSNGISFTYTRDGRTQTLSGTATGEIGITFTAKGIQWVKISATDYDDPDDANDFSGSWSATYTYYVKGPGTSTTTISLVGVSNNGYKTGIFSGLTHRIPIHNGDSSHYDVTYTTIPTGAMAQIENTDGDLGGLAGLPTTGISSALDVLLQANKTYQVTAKVDDSDQETIGVYIIGSPKLTVGYPDNPNGIGTGTISPNSGAKTMPGRINDTLSSAFKVRITDGDESVTPIPGIDFANPQIPGAVPGVVVRFQVRVSGDAGGYLVFNNASKGTLVDSSNRKRLGVNNSPLTMDTSKTLYVRTDASGRADVDFQLGTDRKQDVTISAVGQSKVVSAYAGDALSGNQLVNPESKSSQADGRAGEYELRVKAEDEDGTALSQYHVEFRTSDGTLDDPSDATIATDGGRLPVQTDTQGIAFVFFDPTDSSDSLRVTAHLLDTAPTTSTPTITDNIIDDVVFDISGGGDTGPVNRLAITPTSISGAPDATRAITVTALNTSSVAVSNVSVTLGGLTSFLADGGTLSSTAGVTPFTSTLTLPDTAATHLITAFATGYTSVSTLVTVTAAVAPGPLSITTVGDPVNGQQTIEVSVRNADGTAPSGAVPVTLTGPGISRTVDTLRGTGRAIITLPTATVSYVLTVSATGYTSGSVTLTPSGQTTTRGAAGEADSVEIDGSRQLSGTVDQAMRLRVRVLDANDNGVSDVRVTFRVLAPGRGTFAGARGNGRATQDQTDRNGYASANLTPSDDGDIIVRASAAGVSADVTFIIDVGEAADDDDTETPTPSRDVAPSRDISPVVHLGAASRPPMLWVDGGAIYALVGASPQRFAASVDNALNITVAGGKVYWTEQTGESSGTINSANLNGSGVTELASIMAVPMGIAVDTAGSKLYWTNSRGRIQSANLDGSRITNELQNLPSPMDIALGRGLVYWTQGNGSVRLVNLTGQKIVRDISTGSDTPGSLVIGGSKVYWTEQTGDGSGTINSANLSGTGATQLASILAVPSGIAVDGSRSKLYWTNSRGRIQSADLDGSKIQNVVSGLGSPGDMVLSNSITAPAAAPAETASGSKYDVNGDGTVDNADSDAVTVAIAAGATDAKYDVNGDGTVNVFDLVEIIANRDPGAAGAPTLFGMKMSAAQIDSLQEQIDLLIATNDRSPAAMRTLIYLQQLLVTARPEKTLLLANYPNPFNPETWIPYELATDTDVRLTIYNTQGVVIRSLEFGHQSAGYYTGRDRAAYWDGRNALGERVASGMYFYQLETDEMSLMRKMVILK